MSPLPMVRRPARLAGMKAGMKAGSIALTCLLLVLPAFSEGAESLEELLTQVGEEYAIAYSSPFLYAFGPSMNSGWLFRSSRVTPRSSFPSDTFRIPT